MIAWFFMLGDLASFLVLSLAQFNITFESRFLFAGSAYLIIKAVVFRDFMSIIDGIIGIYMILVFLFGFSSFFYWIILGWFIYKLFFTVIFSFAN